MLNLKGLVQGVIDSLLKVEQKFNKFCEKLDTLFFPQESTIGSNPEELTKVETINYNPVTEYYPLIGDDGSIQCIPVTEL